MIKNYANPLPIGIELATVVDCRRQSSPVGDSPHLSVTIFTCRRQSSPVGDRK